MSDDVGSGSSNGVLVGALAALTIQILRLSMDFVQVATVNATASDKGGAKKPPAASAASGGGGSHNHHGHGHHDHGTKGGGSSSESGSKNSKKNDQKKSYGSIGEGGGGGGGGGESGDGEQKQDGEQTTPLLMGDALPQPPSAPTPASACTSRRVRVYLFSACWILLSALFVAASAWNLLAAFGGGGGGEGSGGSTARPPLPFSTPLLVLTALALLLQLWLHFRDVDRDRYGPIHRTLQLLASLTLWVIYAALAWRSTSTTGRRDFSVFQILVLVAVTAAVLMSLLDGYLKTDRMRLHIQQRRESKVASHPDVFLKLLKPYIWPSASKDSSALLNRIRAVTTWLCVITSKGCGLLSPLFLGWATTSLAHSDYVATIKYSCMYSIVSFLGTTLKEGQSLVYLKVAQAAFVQLSEAAFGHLHSLSLDWHLRKKLGEVLRSMDRGIAACDTLMRYLFLWLVPALAECIVVVIIFATYFDYLPMAVTVFYFVFVYIVWTILVTLWRKKFRKALVQSDNEYHDIFTDSMVNFETVKHFTAEDFEKQRFTDAVSRYQAGSVNVQASLSFLNISQQIILKTCLAVALSLAAVGINKRGVCCVDVVGCSSAVSDCCLNVSHQTCPGMNVGDFVAVLTYTLNLFQPLNFLGSVYNAIVMAIIDLTSMSELLAEQPDVEDAPDAVDLPKVNRDNPDVAIEFQNVFFHYPTQPSSNGLKGLSFQMKRGTTTAIVGPTGAGKTTVSRLLFRFYDVLDGSVKINGVDVRKLKQKSMRAAIGVVPQAASMFNDTIRYNLKYGRPDANQDEIEQAARDAQILNFINSLDDGWETMVGDRGLKLSGGEKQRAAIARCLLKDPPFVLLDEATSALDTITEKSVQEALDRLGAERTVLVIAHRLGTIRKADNIIVLKDGQVAEQGTHDELLAREGQYAEMWNMQLHHHSASTSTSSFGNSPDL